MSVVPTESFDEATLLSYAVSLERASEHPLAQAIVSEAKARGIQPEEASEFKSITGQGITGKVNGTHSHVRRSESSG